MEKKQKQEKQVKKFLAGDLHNFGEKVHKREGIFVFTLAISTNH